MRAMIFDCETLPEDSESHREMRENFGISWLANPGPPEHALKRFPLPDMELPKSAPSAWKDPTKIAQHQKKATAEAFQKNYKAVAKCTESALKWWRDGSLEPTRARIFCISWKCGESQGNCSGDEKPMLEEFNSVLDKFNPSHLVAWNAEFDVAMVFARAMVHGNLELAKKVKLPHHAVRAQFRMYNSKPEVVDAMKVWGQKFVKLEKVCKALDVDHSLENPIDGSEVLDAYMGYRDSDIIDHCEADVRDLSVVWERLEEVHPQFKNTWQNKPLPVINRWSENINQSLGPDPIGE